MGWLHHHHDQIRQLSPEVARFVLQVLQDLERENIFDAPSVLSGVLRQMRVADSDVIRAATGRTELLLKAAFARRSPQRAGA